MIKSFTAITREIDDAKAAVAEILSGLELEKNLMTNSIGIISCFAEFNDTGVLKAICDALPFDCIGATTCLCASKGESDEIILVIKVLTSDDCSFKTIVVPITEQYEESIISAVNDLKKPSLILTQFPLINTVSGDMMLSVIDKATGGTPLFGTMAVDHTMDYSMAKTIYNGNAYAEMLVLGAVYGDVEISFAIASLDDNKIRGQKGVITESNGNILIGVNGKNALEYFEEIGLSKDDLTTVSGIIPFVVDHKDGTKPVTRAVFALTSEGYAVCGGAMPVNATLGIGHIDTKDVLKTTENTIKPLTEGNGALICYSCMARYLTLRDNSKAEVELFLENVGDMQHLFATSGGEICPLPDGTGNLINYFHNYTAVFCKIN